MVIELSRNQYDAINQLKNGSILCGGVGSGKSRTALGYYFFKECDGDMNRPMNRPRDLYIITTAKKRETLEWDSECAKFCITRNQDCSISNVKLTIDSWNNIKKYTKVIGAFFIFDEQRVVGSGAWVKAFLDIARKNHWILLSATPGDSWSDYIPVFVANGFYRNKTEFNARHAIYSRYSKYPKIERYIDEELLERQKNKILVILKDNRHTTRHKILTSVDYDRDLFNVVYRDRWDPYENCPIQESGKLYYLMRKVLNSDPSRLLKVREIFEEKRRCIIFYNFTYELELLRDLFDEIGVEYGEWNGEKHERLPEGERWVYLVQYSAGSEGWNCITCNTIIFFSQSYSYRSTEQASGRIDRMNTPYIDLYYYHLRSSAWLDLSIYKALSRKQNFNERNLMKDV